jgi:hypothetical protein
VSARGTELAGQWAWQLGVNEEANRYALHAPDAQGETTLEELKNGEEKIELKKEDAVKFVEISKT